MFRHIVRPLVVLAFLVALASDAPGQDKEKRRWCRRRSVTR